MKSLPAERTLTVSPCCGVVSRPRHSLPTAGLLLRIGQWSYCLFPNGDVEQSPGLAAVTRSVTKAYPGGVRAIPLSYP
jgi:hypothetical protein